MGGDVKHPQHLALQPMYVDSDSYPLNPVHYNGTRSDSKNSSLLSLESDKFKLTNLLPNQPNRQQRSKIVARSDMIRFQNPVHRANSYDLINSGSFRHPKFGGRPKSLCANTLEYWPILPLYNVIIDTIYSFVVFKCWILIWCY